MELHQLVHTLSYGDAISGEVIGLQRCFRELGYNSEIFCINTHPKYKGLTQPYQTLSPDFSGEVLLHYSLGSPLNELYRSFRSARRSLIHHNLTPAHWFASTNPRIAHDIERGVRELPELCAITDRLIADSRFNAQELAGLGHPAQVLELPIDPQKWSVPANPGILSLLRSDPSFHILHVGRLAPNKCIEDVIRSFYFLKKYVHQASKLWLIGIDIDTELYSFGLKRLVHELGLDDAVCFTGQRDDGEVKAFYQASHAYLCMSEHEGFCLPIIEAMFFDLPVVAYASTALPDTVGTAGVLLREKRHPQIAEVLFDVCRDSALRQRLIAAGRERVGQLSFDVFQKRVAELFSRETRVATRRAVP
ncbi:MAG: glycosyltransferase family 4 protein [Oligoflexia bacterium]|nr:glycosyltransferase family 4 protein [Oligoflexia bacterium]